jgi:hypothetical protein
MSLAGKTMKKGEKDCFERLASSFVLEEAKVDK